MPLAIATSNLFTTFYRLDPYFVLNLIIFIILVYISSRSCPTIKISLAMTLKF